jgi:NitT/TauT family transport system substrate-binding protein
MASSVESGNLDAYFVGEPFAAQTLRSGSSTLVNYVEEVWPGFICNVMIVSDKMIEEQPELVQKLVSMAARSNMWAKQNLDSAAQIASGYWGQNIELVKYAMNTPPGRIAFDMYIPKKEELKQIFDYMVEFELIDQKYEYILDEVYDDSFARNVTFENLTSDIKSIRPK